MNESRIFSRKSGTKFCNKCFKWFNTSCIYVWPWSSQNNILERLQDLWSIIKKFKEDDEGIPTCLENQYNTNFKKLNLESDYWKKFNLRFKWPESNEAEAPSVLLIDNWGICIEIIRNPNKIINVIKEAIPKFLGAMQKNAGTAAGAAALSQALGNHAGQGFGINLEDGKRFWRRFSAAI